MSDLKKCDRCGRHYDPLQETGFELRRQEIVRVFGERHEWDLCSMACLNAVVAQLGTKARG